MSTPDFKLNEQRFNAPSMKLDEAVAMFERRFTGVSSIGLMRADEDYIQLCSGGIVPEGDRVPAWCSSEDVAVNLWLSSAIAYAHGKRGKLIWRVRPMLDVVDMQNGDFQYKFFNVYCLFRIEESSSVGPELAQADQVN